MEKGKRGVSRNIWDFGQIINFCVDTAPRFLYFCKSGEKGYLPFT